MAGGTAHKTDTKDKHIEEKIRKHTTSMNASRRTEGGYQNTEKNRPWMPESIDDTTDRNVHKHVRLGMIAGARRPPMRKAKNATLEMKRTLQAYNKRRKTKRIII